MLTTYIAQACPIILKYTILANSYQKEFQHQSNGVFVCIIKMMCFIDIISWSSIHLAIVNCFSYLTAWEEVCCYAFFLLCFDPFQLNIV